MKPAGVGELGRLNHLDVGEAGEIHNVADTVALTKVRPALLPAEEEASLPAQAIERDPVLAMVSRILGERLTSDNLAWRGDPVPVMRSLQKMLVAHSLTLDQDQRQPALAAIGAVEQAVQWRLRWAQMRRSEAERHFIQPQQDDHATQKTA